MYKTKELADLSGVTGRTLRYYDAIGLLKPATITEAGHRLYGAEELDKLQQILFLKELDFSLKETEEILQTNQVDQLAFFEEQYQALLDKKAHLNNVIELIELTIKEQKGQIKMTDSEKFAAFKEQQLKENREKYGEELKEKYSEESLQRSEEKYRQLTKQELQFDMKETENNLLSLLSAFPEVPSEAASRIYQLHKQWLNFSLDLTPEIHRSLVDMYLADERFTAYYDEKTKTGATEKLNEIVHFYGE